MREMRRKDREISKERAYDILKNSEYGFLATVTEDGSPYCIAVSHALSGDNIYFHCAQQGHKVDNIMRDNRVCFTAVGKTKIIPEDFTTEYESAVAFGRADFIEDREEKLSAALAICEKYTPGQMAQAAEYAGKALDKMHLCRIRIEHATGKANTGK